MQSFKIIILTHIPSTRAHTHSLVHCKAKIVNVIMHHQLLVCYHIDCVCMYNRYRVFEYSNK